MADLSSLRANRIKKLRELRKAGVNPYPERTPAHKPIQEIRGSFKKLLRRSYAVSIVGRVTGLRGHGGALFVDVTDSSGVLQAFFSRETLGVKTFHIAQQIDLGDFVALRGKPFLTKRGEETIAVKELTITSKAIRPLPSQWYGLHDTEERFRYREVDLLLNAEIKERFRKRSLLVRALRQELEREGFLEVETPMLQSVPGGASAEPFKTTLRALRLSLFLRIAPELYLKRLLVGGFEKVYELGRSFRNEGMDQTHNPEFTMLEFYWAYQDLDGLAAFTEKLLRSAVRAAVGSLGVSFRGETLDFGKTFERLEFSDVFQKYVGVHPLEARREELEKRAAKFSVPFERQTPRSVLVDHLFKKGALPKLINPCFVLRPPLEMAPLAKASEKNEDQAGLLQVVAGGIELVKGYAELNDSQEQRRRFAVEAKKRRHGDHEAQRTDEDFLVALEYGMPPAAGFGLGIDRFAMLITDAPSLREVILFPTMRPKKKG